MVLFVCLIYAGLFVTTAAVVTTAVLKDVEAECGRDR